MKFFISFMTAFLLGGCATQLKLNSRPPGADIYHGEKKLGQTPINVDAKNLTDEQAGGYMVSVVKSGYDRIWVWFPAGVRNLEANINMLPFRQSGDSKTSVIKVSRAKTDQVTEKLLSAQTDILLGRGDGEADLSKELPGVSAAMYLEAIKKIKLGERDAARSLMLDVLKIEAGEPDYVALYRELGGDPIVDVEEKKSSLKIQEEIK